jgi:hypothetical protein
MPDDTDPNYLQRYRIAKAHNDLGEMERLMMDAQKRIDTLETDKEAATDRLAGLEADAKVIHELSSPKR